MLLLLLARVGGSHAVGSSSSSSGATAAAAVAAALSLAPHRRCLSSGGLDVGDCHRLTRTFTAQDALAFVRLTGDANPIHLERGSGSGGDDDVDDDTNNASPSPAQAAAAEAAARTPSSATAAAAAAATGHQAAAAAGILPGMLVASLFPAIIGSRFRGALYLSQALKFRRSAPLGATVLASVTVAGRSGGRVTFDTVAADAATGDVLVDGRALALIRGGGGNGSGGGVGGGSSGEGGQQQ